MHVMARRMGAIRSVLASKTVTIEFKLNLACLFKVTTRRYNPMSSISLLMNFILMLTSLMDSKHAVNLLNSALTCIEPGLKDCVCTLIKSTVCTVRTRVT
jgi:hypothetical protein